MKFLNKTLLKSMPILNSRQLSISIKRHLKILHLTAQHSDQSAVSSASKDLLSKLSFPHECTERNLWKQPLPTYNLDHVASKFNLVRNPDSAKDQSVFEPVSALTEELNKQDILLLSTPMWNLTVPYMVKHYIDIVVQPGKTFRQSSSYPHKMTPVKPDRTLVLIYSCGAEVGHDGLKCDYLGNYVREVFKMVGFDHFHVIRIEGTTGRGNEVIGEIIRTETDRVASALNKEFV